jgi:hypothetical protein
MLPGERRQVVFPGDIDILLHRLGGLELEHAMRVGFRTLVRNTGEVLDELPDAPLRPAAGEVLNACQKHFAAMPADAVPELRVESEC